MQPCPIREVGSLEPANWCYWRSSEDRLAPRHRRAVPAPHRQRGSRMNVRSGDDAEQVAVRICEDDEIGRVLPLDARRQVQRTVPPLSADQSQSGRPNGPGGSGRWCRDVSECHPRLRSWEGRVVGIGRIAQRWPSASAKSAEPHRTPPIGLPWGRRLHKPRAGGGDSQTGRQATSRMFQPLAPKVVRLEQTGVNRLPTFHFDHLGSPQ